MKLWQAFLGRTQTQEIARYDISQYANDIALAFQGNRYLLGGGSSGYTKTEDIENSFTGYINSMYKSNGIVFAIVLSRMMLFSEARFCWFDIADNGEDGRAAGRKGLELLEQPWPNGGTGELLARAEQDVSLGGNSYTVREPDRLRRLRPDWLTIVLTAPPAEATRSDVAGYWYHPGRVYGNAGEPGPTDEVYLPGEIAHFSPVPDPDAQYRGMSWLTPVVREVMGDSAARDHKLAFFENGATLGAIISAKETLTNAQYKEWKANFEGIHTGTRNAYRALFLANPVDTSITTADMRQLDFKVTIGAGETRLCAAGGVPPIIVGLSEGLASATYCLPGDSLVWAQTGPTPIREVRAGDFVWSHVGSGLALRRVNWQAQTGYKQVFAIRTRNRILRASGNHPVLVRVKGTIGGGPNATRHARTEWRTVDQLQPGDRVVQVQHLPDEIGGYHLPDGTEATPDMLRWLGAYVGDGCGAKAHGQSSIQMCIPPADRVRDHYEKLTTTLFEGVHIGEGNPRSFRFNSAVLARALVGWGFGGTATTKRVPRWVFSLRRDLRLHFLAGLVDTDGSVDKRGTLKVQLANRPLVEDVKMLLVGCGIQVSNLYEQIFQADVLPNPGKADTYVSWAITSSSAVEVAQIPFDDWLYRGRVEANAGRRRRAGQNSARAGLDDCLGFFTVRSITPGVVEPVYDINVDEGASFVADGVVVHNSNYGLARRKFGDGWAKPQWRVASQALASIFDPPGEDLRLGVNTRGIAFLREDAKDLAEIIQIRAATVSTLISAGFKPGPTIIAVDAEDLTLLEDEHTGLTSVQLVPPGTQDADGDGVPDGDAAADDEYEAALESFRAQLLDEDEIQRDRYNVRNPGGSVGGGRFRKLSDAIVALLKDWDGEGDPFKDDDGEEMFNQRQLRTVGTDLGIELPPPRRGKNAERVDPELKRRILTHVKGKPDGDEPDAPASAKKAAPRKAPAKKAAPKKAVIGPSHGEAHEAALPARPLSPEALEIVGDYHEGWSANVNSALRVGEGVVPPADAKSARIARGMDEIMAGQSLTRDIEVERGIPVSALTRLLGGDPSVGSTYTDHGFVSTTTTGRPRLSVDEESAVLHIRAPKGTSALSTRRTGERGELDPGEVVLDRGLTYRVTGVEVRDGIRHVNVEIVSGDDGLAKAPRAPAKKAVPRKAVPTAHAVRQELVALPADQRRDYLDGLGLTKPQAARLARDLGARVHRDSVEGNLDSIVKNFEGVVGDDGDDHEFDSGAPEVKPYNLADEPEDLKLLRDAAASRTGRVSMRSTDTGAGSQHNARLDMLRRNGWMRKVPSFREYSITHTGRQALADLDAPDLEQQARDRQADTPDDMQPGEGPVDYKRRKKVEALSAGVETATSRAEALEHLKGHKDSELRLLAREFGVDTRIPVPGDRKSRTPVPSTTRAATHDELAELVLQAFVFDGYDRRWKDNNVAAALDLEQQARDRQADIDDARRHFNVAAEVDELVANEASDRALLHRLDALGKREGTTELIAPIRAALVGDPERVREVEVENRIRAAYRSLQGRTDLPGTGWHQMMRDDYVLIADLRDEAPDIPRAEFDAILRRLTGPEQAGVAIPEAKQSILRPQDREGGLQMGDQEKHWLQLEDPSDRPLPSGDRDRARALAADLLSARGVEMVHHTDEVITFDRATHEPIGDGIRTGASVLVVRPGMLYTPPGDDKPVRVRAKVQQFDGPAIDDGLDSMPEDRLRRYAPEWDVKTTGRTRAQITADLREAGAASPEKMRERAQAEAVPGPPAAPLSSDPTDRAAQIEDRIRTLVAELQERPGGWVELATLRDHLGGMDRAEVDRVLTSLSTMPGVRVVPESNQMELTPKDRAAAVVIGNRIKHLIAIEPPERPPPATPDTPPVDIRQVEVEQSGGRTRVNSTPTTQPKATPPNPQSSWGQTRDDQETAWSPIHGRPGNLDQVDQVYTADSRDAAREYLQTRSDDQLEAIGDAVDADMGALTPKRDRRGFIERLMDEIREPEMDAPSDIPDPETTRDALDLLKVEGPGGLKAMLKARGLPVSGRKRDLVDRLVEHIGQQPGSRRARIAEEIRQFADMVRRAFDARERETAPEMDQIVAGLRDGSLTDADAARRVAALADSYLAADRERGYSGSAASVNLRAWSQALDRLVGDLHPGDSPTQEPSVATPTPFDQLLDGPQAIGHKQSRQILEQMEAHGWTLKTHDRNYGVTVWEAADGRRITMQFGVGRNNAPVFRDGQRDLTYRAALGHVVTPSLKEPAKPNIYTASENLGIARPDDHGGNRFMDSLMTAQRAMQGAQWSDASVSSATADLREEAQRVRVLADDPVTREFGSTRVARLREEADLLDRYADELDRMHAAHKAYEQLAEQRLTAPLDIRPTSRSPGDSPTAPRTGGRAAGGGGGPKGEANEDRVRQLMSTGLSREQAEAEVTFVDYVRERDRPRLRAARPARRRGTSGEAALAVPPASLATLTEENDPRAEALWHRAGDNGLETDDRRPGYASMNEYMRDDDEFRFEDPEMDRRIADIDSVMRESRLRKVVYLYRGVGDASDFGEGVEFTDRAFVSTTTDREHAAGFGFVMRIRVPSGTPAVRMADRDGDPPESEILLDRGLRFRVIAVWDDEIDVEVVT